MFYVGIDQHRKQLTVSVREETGNVIVRRQVSTEWPRIGAFLDELTERSAPEGGYLAVVEICGFNHWLLKLLAERGCRETIVVQPESGGATHVCDCPSPLFSATFPDRRASVSKGVVAGRYNAGMEWGIRNSECGVGNAERSAGVRKQGADVPFRTQVHCSVRFAEKSFGALTNSGIFSRKVWQCVGNNFCKALPFNRLRWTRSLAMSGAPLAMSGASLAMSGEEEKGRKKKRRRARCACRQWAFKGNNGVRANAIRVRPSV